MSKHNKKRNTAFIYEALVREVVKQSIAKNVEKRNLAISLLKEFFNKNTLLYKDLQLYKSILETKEAKEKIAFKILVEAKNVKTNINKKMLFMEQSKIIKKRIVTRGFYELYPNLQILGEHRDVFWR